MNILPLFIVFLIVNGKWNIHNRELLKILVAVNPHMVNTISLFPLIPHLPKQFMVILCGFNCLFVEHLHLFFPILIPFSFYLCPITCRKKFANLLQDLIYLIKIGRIHKEYASLGRSVYKVALLDNLFIFSIYSCPRNYLLVPACVIAITF